LNDKYNKLIIYSSNQATYRLLEKSHSYNTRKRKKIISRMKTSQAKKIPNLYIK